jgi:hypothetical protein
MITAMKSADASAPAGLDEVVAALLKLHELHMPARAGEQPQTRSRPCRCERPVGLADEWLPSWTRCLLCGRDIPDEAGGMSGRPQREQGADAPSPAAPGPGYLQMFGGSGHS